MKSKLIAVTLSALLTFNICTQASLQPVSAQTQVAKISEGNKYADIGHNAYKAKDYLKAAQNYEKAYELTKAKVYDENAKVAYTSYAFDLANDKNYDKAIFYANKVLSANSNNKNVKELLSDIYFSRGADYFYDGNTEKARADFQESLKHSVMPDQKERAKDALAKIQNVAEGKSTLAPQNEATSDTSIPEAVTKMETKVYGTNYKTKSLLERVSKLEKDSLGKTYESDGLIIRIDRLKQTLMPELITHTTPTTNTQAAYANTYIPAIIDQSMGKVTVFGHMPITVFIDDAEVKPYKKFYKDAVLEAMKEWENASDNKIKFQTINEPAKSDIKIVWSENFEDFPWQPTLQKEDISAEKQRMKYRKANAMVQVGSVAAMLAGGLFGVPVIGGIGGFGNGLASPILQYKGMNVNRLSPDVKINVKVTEGMSDEQAKAKIKQTALHQIGHAIGIVGHSPYPEDIMFQNFTANDLSQRDINTIKEIYTSQTAAK